MLGNNLPYGTPRFDKAFLLQCLKEEKENVTFMKTLDIYSFSDEARKLYTAIIEEHEVNCDKLLKKIKFL